MFVKAVNASLTDWVDINDDRFINWMNMETFSDFRKTWGRVSQSMAPGVYKLSIISCKFCLHITQLMILENIQLKKDLYLVML